MLSVCPGLLRLLRPRQLPRCNCCRSLNGHRSLQTASQAPRQCASSPLPRLSSNALFQAFRQAPHASCRLIRHAHNASPRFSRSQSSNASTSTPAATSCGPLKVSHVLGGEHPPLVEDTLYDYFATRVSEFGDRPCVTSRHQGDAGRFTFGQLDEAAARLASGFDAIGLQRGDRVAMWSFNSWEWVAMQVATARLGLILVNLSPAYTSSELSHALKLTGCKAVVTQIGQPPQGGEYPFMSILREVVPELSSSGGTIQSPNFPELKHIIGVAAPSQTLHHEGIIPFADLMHTSPDTARLDTLAAQLCNNDPINIQFTSGTTGLAKGTTLSHRNILNNAIQIAHRMNLSEKDSVCVPVPMFHCFGLVLGSLAALSQGGSIVFPAEVFDPRKTLEAVHHERCTALHGVPTMFLAELNLPDFDAFDCTTLRTGIMAGTLCPAEIMRRVVADMHIEEMTVCYGMTETSPVTFQTKRTDGLSERTTSIGVCHPHVEAKIVPTRSEDELDEDVGPIEGELDTAPVPVGTSGELWTRGYCVMLGYWGQPEKTAEAIVDGGWMRTGDLAVMDEAGYCRIVGRSKDVIIRGGENIFPKEVEDCLRDHPEIDDVEVVGVPDSVYGEEVCAVIKMSPNADAPLTVDDIANYCKGRMAKYKIPRYLSVIGSSGPEDSHAQGAVGLATDFPMTLSGKVQKYRLRKMVSRAASPDTAPLTDSSDTLPRLLLQDRFGKAGEA